MNLLAVNGGRINGNTEELVTRILKSAEEQGAQTELFKLREMNIAGCSGCELCKVYNKCIVDDDMQQIYSAMDEADALIIGSGIYMFSLAAQTKTFVDRLYARINHSGAMTNLAEFLQKVEKDNPEPDKDQFAELVRQAEDILKAPSDNLLDTHMVITHGAPDDHHYREHITPVATAMSYARLRHIGILMQGSCVSGARIVGQIPGTIEKAIKFGKAIVEHYEQNNKGV